MSPTYSSSLHLFRFFFQILSAACPRLLLCILVASPTYASDDIGAAPSSDLMLLILFVMVALVFSFICSVAEAVLLSITPSYIQNLESTDAKKAALVRKLRQENIDRSLAAILTVNTIAHTVGAIAAGAKATSVFGSAWIGVFSGAMTLAILFLSEIIPKTIGAVYWPKLVGFTAFFIQISIKVLYPLIIISEGLTKLIAKRKSVHLFSRDELIAMTEIGERTGHMQEHEALIIRNLMHSTTLKATDIMTPRTVMTALHVNMTISDAIQAVLEHSFSRLPLYDNDIDDIKGVALRDEILAIEAQDKGDTPLSSVARPLEIVSADTTLPSLLEHFLASRQHLALVVDKFGGTKGLVSLEDVIETLLGREIVDEMDNVEDMQILARKQWEERAEKLGIDTDPINSEETKPQ